MSTSGDDPLRPVDETAPPADRLGGPSATGHDRDAPASDRDAGTTAVEPPARDEQPEGPKHASGSKTSAVFVFSAVGAIILLLLLIFILQNLKRVPIEFIGFKGTIPVGVALLLAAVAGALLVAIAGGLRILQLRRRADSWRR